MLGPLSYGLSPLGKANLVTNYTSFLLSLAPYIWMPLRETSGTTADNLGSIAADGTIDGCTLGQTGQLGTNEAFSWDGAGAADDLLTFPNNAAWANLTDFEFTFLANPASAGEGNAARFFQAGAITLARFAAATRTLRFQVDYDTTDGLAITTTTLSASAWSMVSFQYNEAGADRFPHIFINGTEATYAGGGSAPVATVGTLVAPITTLQFGNLTTKTATFDGLFDEIILTRSLTTAERAQLKGFYGL